MRKVAGPVVGISFTEDAIYAVAAQPGPSGAAEVTHVASTRLPDGILGERDVVNPGVAAAALKRLLADNKITTRAAVIGLPSRAIFARLVNIPPVPPEERRAVVRGEIDHLAILPPGQGAFDFVTFSRITDPARPGLAPRDLGGKGEPVFFFAAEHPVVQGYRAVAQEAGLRVVGMEPSDYAAVRTIYPRLADKPLTLAISFGSFHTEILFYQNGNPVYGRRLDVGIQQMTVPEILSSPTGQRGGWQMVDTLTADLPPLSGMGQAPAPGMATGPAEQIASSMFDDKLGRANQARQMLTQEIGRSLDYFRREYKLDVSGLYIVLLPNNLDLAGMPIYMTAALEQDVDFAYAFEYVRTPSNLGSSLLQEEGVAFAPALGLALGQLGGKFAGVEAFDLSVEDAEVVRARQAPRQLVAALGGSAAVLALSAGTALFLATRHVPVKADLATARKVLRDVSAQEKALLTEQNQQVELVQKIRSQNIPWTNVLRFLAESVPTSVGLTSVTADDSRLSVQGESLSQIAVTNFWNRLVSSPFFTNPALENSASSNGKVTFTMTAMLPPPPAAAAAANAAIAHGAPRYAWSDIRRSLEQFASHGVALTNVSARGALLSFVGRAPREEAVMAFWSGMQGSSFFGQPAITRMYREGGSIVFEMTTTLPGLIEGETSAPPPARGR